MLDNGLKTRTLLPLSSLELCVNAHRTFTDEGTL